MGELPSRVPPVANPTDGHLQRLAILGNDLAEVTAERDDLLDQLRAHHDALGTWVDKAGEIAVERDRYRAVAQKLLDILELAYEGRTVTEAQWNECHTLLGGT